jgi:enoyl-CoA hydratase/carnithine racemase
MRVEVWREHHEALYTLEANADIRVTIIAGEGRAFCAGADVKEMTTRVEEFRTGAIPLPVLREWQISLQDSTRKIRKSRFPYIAAIHGIAVGAGCELCMACDLIVAEEGTQIGFPEVSAGVTVTNGGNFFTLRLVGLANRGAAKGTAREEAGQVARRIASRAPVAVALHKTIIDRALDSRIQPDYEARLFRDPKPKPKFTDMTLTATINFENLV